MAYRIDMANYPVPDDGSLQWIYECIFVLACVQGFILCAMRSWKFVLWFPVSIVGGWVGFSIGLFFCYLFFFALRPLGLAFAIGGGVVGFGQGLILKRFPKANVMILATALSYWFLWTPIVLIFLQASDRYTSLPDDFNFARIVAYRGAIAGLIQCSGLLYILNHTPKNIHSSPSKS
ncbi:hypothetical protein [Vacuolonema iberomarrocanum]|uniref:hypothetical protein n=1 Tax=Vacuolonema iberomarrocanum TaxID=3454632 RepID=UPI0019FC4CE3|nr:hypothetical protein [filamentous cyanobacterium LEGE 07170]